ncbi:MAG: hypothetical protein ABL966_09770, partial [Acidimicrobiales bacterium]
LHATVATDDNLEASTDAEREAIAEQIVAVETEMDEARVTIEIESIGGRWADLLRDSPPSGDQRLLGFDNNPDKFQPAALAACAVNPTVSIDQARKLREVLDEGEWGRLFATVQNLNRSPMPHPKLAAATELLRQNERSSTTSDPVGSLEDGSSASGASQ